MNQAKMDLEEKREKLDRQVPAARKEIKVHQDMQVFRVSMARKAIQENMVQKEYQVYKDFQDQRVYTIHSRPTLNLDQRESKALKAFTAK